MRYQTSLLGGPAWAVGNFATGRTVTIELWNLATGAVVPLDDDSCAEIGTEGIFRWSSGEITTPPTVETQYVYRMTDATSGHQHHGKLILGGYPDTVAAIVADVWDELLIGATHNIPTSAGRRLRELVDAEIIHEGGAQAGTALSITLDAGADANDNFYIHTDVIIVDGTGVGQARKIHTYNGTTKVAVILIPWIVTPDNTSGFEIVRGTGAHVEDIHSHATGEIDDALSATHGLGSWESASLEGLKRGRSISISPKDSVGTTVSARSAGNVTVSAKKCC